MMEWMITSLMTLLLGYWRIFQTLDIKEWQVFGSQEEYDSNRVGYVLRCNEWIPVVVFWGHFSETFSTAENTSYMDPWPFGI